MSKSSFVLATALAATMLAPLPAMARDRSLTDAAARLEDPEFQHGMASALGTMMRALMGMKMAPFAQAMNQMKHATGDTSEPDEAIDPEATIGDMVGEEGRRAPEEIADKLPGMMSAMAGMAGAMEQMRPELEKMGKEMARRLPRDLPRD